MTRTESERLLALAQRFQRGDLGSELNEYDVAATNALSDALRTLRHFDDALAFEHAANCLRYGKPTEGMPHWKTEVLLREWES